MKKIFPHTLLGIIVLLMFTTSCVRRLNDTAYLKYIASKDSFFVRITFEYPEEWSWIVRHDAPSADFGMIHASNPNSTELYRGFIIVRVTQLESQIEAISAMESDIVEYLETRTRLGGKIVSDQVFEIDSHSFRHIITKIGPSEGVGELPAHGPAISEAVYILVENSYYIINFDILESERQSRFGQGFDHMIETIQFLP